MSSVRLPLSGDVNQLINPMSWTNSGQLSFFSVDLGSSAEPEIEQAILANVGSYGRQLGRLGDVVAILLKHADQTKFTEHERTCVADLEAQLRSVDSAKKRHRR